MSFCQASTREQFEALRNENDAMRQQLADINTMMEDIVRVRKAVMDKKLVEFEANQEESSGVICQIKKELLNLRNSDIELSSLSQLRDNMRKFKDFMDKVDSINFGMPSDQGASFQFNPEHSEVEEVKNIIKLKDLLCKLLVTSANYKYVIGEQDKLIQKSISRTSTSNSDIHRIEAKRLGVLDEFGLDRARQFIDDQRKYMLTCRSQFVGSLSTRKKSRKPWLTLKRD